MATLIQKIIYTSIGIASVTNEKFKELVEDLIQNNHFTEDEGKRIVDEFLYGLRQQTDDIQANFQLKVDELLKKAGIPGVLTIKDEVEKFVKDVKEHPAHLLKLPGRK